MGDPVAVGEGQDVEGLGPTADPPVTRLPSLLEDEAQDLIAACSVGKRPHLRAACRNPCVEAPENVGGVEDVAGLVVVVQERHAAATGGVPMAFVKEEQGCGWKTVPTAWRRG